MEGILLLIVVMVVIFYVLNIMYGEPPPYNPELICPHCQVKGKIRTKFVEQKKGISGGKAVGAIMTAGLSMLATGLSRKEKVTEAHCDNCNSTWYF